MRVLPLFSAIIGLAAAAPVKPSGTSDADEAYPTNLHYVSNGTLNDPPVKPHKPKGGIGENVTAIITDEFSTGYGKPIPADGPKNPDQNAGFKSSANTGKGASTLLSSGVWNGTYALNSTEATYHPLSDFDYQSLALGLLQEYFELDLFRAGFEMFSREEFHEYGLTDADINLLHHMSNQEIGHAQIFENMLGPSHPRPCKWRWPFKTVGEFIDFSMLATRWGEASVYGFLNHLDSRPTAQLILQSITVEARQQMIFRQMEGLHAMPEWHETAITQSMHWTIQAPYVESCPAENPKLIWANFPDLNITNSKRGLQQPGEVEYKAGITNERVLSTPGERIFLQWEEPGKAVGPNNSYVTSTMAGAPKFAAWISQLNVTYTPLEDINGTSAWTVQPWGTLFDGEREEYDTPYPGVVNNTVFVFISDADVFVTPFNSSRLDDHVVAGPAMYESG